MTGRLFSETSGQKIKKI